MKTITTGNQPAKAEVTGAEAQSIHNNSTQKSYRDHKIHDRTHGRVNKNPIGVNHEPGLF